MMSWIHFRVIQAWEWEETWVAKQDWPRLIIVETERWDMQVHSTPLSTLVFMV